MGSQDRYFADDLIDELRDRIPNSRQVAFRSIYWADVLIDRQTRYLRSANAGNQLDYMGLRRFVVSALGDATAYRRAGDDPRSTYGQIHTRVRDAIKDLFENPALVRFLTNYETSNALVSEALAFMQEKEDSTSKDAALQFLRTNEDLWSGWVPADVAARVKAALATS